MSDTETTTTINRACDLGRDAGKAAASWIFDGNTSPETYRQVLIMIEDGDPLLYSQILEPRWLGGIWAGDPTPTSLARELGLDDLLDLHLLDEACTEYETAASDAFWHEVEAFARRMVEDWT